MRSDSTENSLTAYVADFIVGARAADIPADVKAMIEKIDYGVHPEAEAAGYEKMTTIIDIELTDGRKISGRVDFGKGSPSNPMSDEEFANKFRECAAWGRLPQSRAEKVIELVFGLEKLKNIRALTQLLQAGAR